MGEGSDEAWVAETVADACEEVLTSLEGVLNIDWNDLGEVTIVTERGTFRGCFIRLGEDD